MNLVIISGEIISNIDFRFIYDRYRGHNEKHTSIVRCRLKLLDGNEVEIYGYDNIADKMFRFYQCGSNILVKGSLDQSMNVNIDVIKPQNFKKGIRYLFGEDVLKLSKNVEK